MDISGTMKKFSGAMVQPVMFLAVAGIVLALSAIFRMEFMPGFVVAIGDFFYNLFMNGVINNLAVIFCVGLTCALAKKKKGDAAVVGIASFLCFLYANNYWLGVTDGLVDSEVLTGTGQALILGVQVVDMGVFISLILGCLNGWIFNKLCDVKLPDAIRVYGGTKLAFLVCVLVAGAVGILACYVWPVVSGLLLNLQSFIEHSGNIGLFVYGFLNRILIPTGLHHLVYMPFMYSNVGGVAEIAGTAYQGAAMIYTAEIGNIGTVTDIDPSVKYMVFGFSKIFGTIGTVLAFIATAKPEKKAETKALLIPVAVTAVVAGITEPLEFMYLFVSPLLFLVHSVLDGLFQVILVAAGYLMSCGNLMNVIADVIVIPWNLSNWWVLIPVGLAAIAVWFLVFRALIVKLDLKTPGREDDGEQIDLSKMNAKSLKGAPSDAGVSAAAGDALDVQHIIDGLGGADNIENVLNCFTRLRVDLKDMSKIDEAELNKYPNKGLVRGKKSVQVIIGMKVQDVCEQVNNALGRTME